MFLRVIIAGVFLVFLVLVFLLIPKKIFHSYFSILGVLLGIITAITLTRFVRNIKEKAVAARSGGGFNWGIIRVVLVLRL